MSERTAEYALVPNLVAQLTERFQRVIPVYFWGTREGSRVGRESGEGQTVKVVAIFARRPKVRHPGCDSILVKINNILFSTANAGADVGVGVIAGVPLVSSLTDFSINSQCSWFQLTSDSEENEDREFRLMITDGVVTSPLPEGITGPLDKAELIQKIDAHCRELEWDCALDAMRHVKSIDGTQHRFFGGSYRPFFLLLTNEDR